MTLSSSNRATGRSTEPRGRRAGRFDLTEALERRALFSAGDLDVSFGGGDGIAAHPDAAVSQYPAALAAAPDGKLYAVGTNKTPSGTRDFSVARYDADGSLDTAFGDGGYQTIDFGGGDEAADAVVQGDGKVVVVGFTDPDLGLWSFAVARLNPDGSLDASFDGDGTAVIPIGTTTSAVAAAVALAPGGKLVVAGRVILGAQRADMAVVRLNPDGSPDPTFDGDSRAVVSFGETALSDTTGVAVDADGDVVVIGYNYLPDPEAQNPLTVARLNADGSLDTSFSGDGRAVLNDPNPNVDLSAGQAAFVDGGKVVISYGTSAAGGPFDVGALRLNGDGSLDTTFGAGGRRQVTTPAIDNLRAFAVQPDGKLLLGVHSRSDPRVNSVIRLTPDGSPDPTFGGGDGIGELPYEYGPFGLLADLVVQPSGRVVGLGWGHVADQPRFALAALTPAGLPDPSFRFDLFDDDEAGRTGAFSDVLVLPDGKLLAVGETTGGVYLARFNPDGSFDTTFSGDGKVVSDVGGNVTRLAIQPDGRILAHGSVLLRFNADGTLDNSFGGGDGIAASPEAGDGLALQPDGRILVTEGRLVARYNVDGTLDTTFGDGGRVIFDDPIGLNEYGEPYGGVIPEDVAWQPHSGRIVVAGQTPGVSLQTDFAAVRLNLDGSIDTTFGNGAGIVTVDTGDIDFGGRIELGSDGAIYMAGEEEDEDPTIVYFDRDGRGGGSRRLPWLGDTSDVSVGPDGEIVVIGDAERPDPVHNDIHVIRLHPNLTIDTTFGGPKGVWTDVFGLSDDFPHAVAVAPDGDLIVAARASNAPVLLRYDGGGAVRIEQAYVRGADWAAQFTRNMGPYGVRLAPRAQDNPTLPWVNLNQISLRFNRPVMVGRDDLRVSGLSVPQYGIAGFRYDPDARTAVWTLDRALGADKLLAVLDADGVGAFSLRFNVLPGDVDNSGTVLAGDASAVKRRFFQTVDGPFGPDGYTHFHDLDGSGTILANDFTEVKKRFFDRLPDGEPARTPASASAAKTSRRSWLQSSRAIA